jgi:hypothetical protein
VSGARTIAAPSASIDIITACSDPDIFGGWFRDRATWTAWFVVIKVLFGIALSAEELVSFQRHTGRTKPAPGGYFDVSLICGRRAGKSLVLALCAAYFSAFFDWQPFLVGGERATIMIIATDRRQAAVIFKYLREMLGIPLLNGIIERETNELLDLANGVTVEIATASFRTLRGRTIVLALADELAFWMTDSGVNPDSEIIGALRPAQATIPNARLLKASSPYARKGVLWNDFRKHYGVEDSRTLVWRASTRDMNPSIPQSFVDEAYAHDPAHAAAEYGAEFRSDIESFVSHEVVDACVVEGRHELPPLKGVEYVGFCDPSGGSSDAMTLAIGHRDGEHAILDALREVKPPFSPESVVREFSDLLKSYNINTIVGDRYAGAWPAERFSTHGISYEPSAKPKSDLYRDLLPVLNGGRAELLDHPKLIAQLCSLERRTSRGGRDSIDHPPGQHDDIANAVAGVLTSLIVDKSLYVWRDVTEEVWGRAPALVDAAANWTAAQAAHQCGELVGRDLYWFKLEQQRRAQKEKCKNACG